MARVQERHVGRGVLALSRSYLGFSEHNARACGHTIFLSHLSGAQIVHIGSLQYAFPVVVKGEGVAHREEAEFVPHGGPDTDSTTILSANAIPRGAEVSNSAMGSG
jgi:hypothetical protein